MCAVLFSGEGEQGLLRLTKSPRQVTSISCLNLPSAKAMGMHHHIVMLEPRALSVLGKHCL